MFLKADSVIWSLLALVVLGMLLWELRWPELWLS